MYLLIKEDDKENIPEFGAEEKKQKFETRLEEIKEDLDFDFNFPAIY